MNYSNSINNLFKLGDLKELSKEDDKFLVKEAIKQLSKCSERAKPLATYIQDELNANLPINLREYRIELGKLLEQARKSRSVSMQCGFISTGREAPADHPAGREKRKFVRANDTTSNKKPKTDDSCDSCGRKGHDKSKCLAPSFHSDYNRESVPWAESTMGKAWLQKDPKHTVLPFGINLRGETQTIPVNLKPKNKPGMKTDKKCKCTEYLSVLHLPNNPSDTIPVNIHVPMNSQARKLNCSALLDSGALHGNYIREDMAKEAVDIGYILTHDTTTVCTPFSGMCVNTTAVIQLNILFLNEVLKITQNLFLTFKVIDMNHEMIIGKQTIREHDLTVKCRSNFITIKSNKRIRHTDKNNKNKNKIKNNTSAEMAATLTDSLLGGPPNSESSYSEVGTVFPTQTDEVSEQGVDTKHIRRHIHDLIGKDTELDELTKEKLKDQGDISPWDIYSDEPVVPFISDEEDIFPTKVENFKERHNIFFNKYKHVFSRTVNKTASKLPPMTLQVDEDMWEVSRHRLAPRLQSVAKQEEIIKQIKKMTDLNVIQPSQATEWSQVMLAPKPNNAWRFCIDFKNLNVCTKGMGFPLPLISLIKARIGAKKAKYYAVIDLTAGYHQIPLHENSRKYTAFRTLTGLYHWLRLPFGLKGAPAYFQSIMATVVLAGILYTACETYLDDILVFGTTEDEYFSNLEKVFDKLSEYDILANPEKGKFGMSEVDYIGHHFTCEGVTHNRERINKVLDIEKPIHAKQLKSFVGVIEYFHDHIQNFATILRPLRKLITPYHKTHVIRWTNEAELAFEQAKIEINNCPTLYFMDPKAPVFLHTDASDYGIGAYLFQVVDGKDRPIMYMSKALTSSEIKWATIEKECYAIVYALYKFEYLLRDIHFTLRTDHKNLTYMVDSKSQRVQRWRSEIQTYDIEVVHIPGEENVLADAFSRILNLNTEEISELIETENNIVADTDAQNKGEDLPNKSPNRNIIPHDKYNIIKRAHNTVVGHHGVDRTYKKITQHLLKHKLKDWKNIKTHICLFIKHCPVCQKLNVIKPDIHANKFTLSTYQPMEKIYIDTINMDRPDDKGNQSIIVMVDSFTRWVDMFPSPDYTARSAATALLQFIGRYGVPSVIHTDQGSQFVNEIMQQFTQLLGIEHTINIAAYSHEENGMVERANKEIMRHLRAFIHDKRTSVDWSNNLPMIQRIINASDNESIGTSPSNLLFGNALSLNRNIFLPEERRPSVTNLSSWLAARLQNQDIINEQARTILRARDENHNSQTSDTQMEYAIGDFVLISYPESVHHSGPPSKLMSNLRGPMKIMERNGSAYGVLDLATHNIEWVHVKRIHPFHCDKELIDPRTVALTDKQYYEINCIQKHKGDIKKLSTLTFEVLWASVNNQPSEITWEPWKTLRSTHALHTYLRNNGLERLIPKEYI